VRRLLGDKLDEASMKLPDHDTVLGNSRDERV
jgi:hypothetical protein